MYISSPEAERLYAVIDKTGVLTTAQAERILPQANPNEKELFSARVLRQLQYAQKIRFLSERLVVLPHLAHLGIDGEMLSAIDIMFDLANGAPLELSANKPPFKLCFLAESNGKIGSYGIVIAPRGNEKQINFLLEGTENRTVIFLLAEPEQRDKLKTALPHYFAVADGEKYRYFKGE